MIINQTRLIDNFKQQLTILNKPDVYYEIQQPNSSRTGYRI